MNRRTWVWAGRVSSLLALTGLSGYLYAIGLDRADKVASSMGVIVALAAFTATFLRPASTPPVPEPSDAPTNPKPPITPPSGAVDARGSHGVQNNVSSSGAIQVNHFTVSRGADADQQ